VTFIGSQKTNLILFSRAGVFLIKSFCTEGFFMKKTLTIIGILVLVVIGIQTFHPVANVEQNQTTSHSTAIPTQTKPTTFSYKGQDGKDALTLLKQKTTVEQNKSGLVIAIAGNKPTGHNYWAFYVNGKYAQVGPAQYKTKNSDTILWKVEKY
jgi:hypothetical protein